MPRRELGLLLQDIIDHAERAARHMGSLSPDAYRDDWLRRDAVERCLIVVGEALNQASQQDPAVMARITSARQIISFRNIVVHGYAMIEPEIVHDIVLIHLPVLLAEARRLLRESDSGR